MVKSENITINGALFNLDTKYLCQTIKSQMYVFTIKLSLTRYMLLVHTYK